MYKRRTIIATLAVGMCVLAPAAPTRADLIIDDFSQPHPQVVTILTMQGGHKVIETSHAAILGGERDVLIVAKDAGPVTYAGTLGQGVLMFGSASPGGARAWVQYDGVDVDGSGLYIRLGLGPVDLTQYGSGFYLDFLSAEGGASTSTDIIIEVLAEQGGFAKFSGQIPNSSTPFRYVAPFSSFSSQGTLTRAANVTFKFNDPCVSDVDFVLDEVGIPEPAALSLLAVAGMALTARRRRRR